MQGQPVILEAGVLAFRRERNGDRRESAYALSQCFDREIAFSYFGVQISQHPERPSEIKTKSRQGAPQRGCGYGRPPPAELSPVAKLV